MVPQTIDGFVVPGSHRACGKVLALLGADRQAYRVSFSVKTRQCVGYPVTAAEMTACLAIPNVRRVQKESKGILWAEG